MSSDIGARPSVSVVVPFLDRERHIQACIESLLRQEGVQGALEVIFIDNGSTDASVSIVARYDQVTLLAEPKPGAYAARNTGVRRATAPLLAFTDADCVVDRHWIRSIQDAMDDPRTAMLVGPCFYDARASPVLHLIAAYENAKTEYVLTGANPAHRFAYANNLAVRTSVLEELGPFKEWRRAADTELVHRLSRIRPDLRLVYYPAPAITHLEFRTACARLRRLRFYRRTNSRVPTFRELGVLDRLAVVWRLLRRAPIGRDGGAMRRGASV